MHAKEFLESIQILNSKIKAKQEEIVTLNSLLYKVNQEMNPDRVQTSRNLDPFASTIAKICDMQAELNNMIDEYVEKLQNVIDVLEQVKDVHEYDLLHMKYIQNMSWSQIAGVWDVSYTWVHMIKKRAWMTVQAILDGEKE